MRRCCARSCLGNGYSYTLEEAGHIFKVTCERIRQIEAKAVRKLQQRRANPITSKCITRLF